ncbi:MAG: ABC transporter permease [Nitrososphaerota archaeon]
MSFRALLYKELKELFLEKSIIIGVIIMPLLLFPILGGVISFTVTEVVKEETIEHVKVAVENLDRGIYSKLLIQKMLENGLQIVVVEDYMDLRRLFDEGVPVFLRVPENFTESIMGRETATIYITYNVEVVRMQTITFISRIVNRFSKVYEEFAETIAKEKNIDLEFYKMPIREISNTFFRGGSVNLPPEYLVNTVVSLVYGLPLVALIIISLTATISATSVGLEKETKTLEILLTLPISRLKILFVKMLATTIISLIGMASFMIGFTIYITSISLRLSSVLQQSTTSSNFDLLPQPQSLFMISFQGIPLLLIAIFATMLLTMSIGVLVGVLADDVRGAQQLVGAATFLPMFPAFFINMFLEVDDLDLPAKILMYINPYTHFFKSLNYIVSGEFLRTLLPISIIGLYTFILLAISAWIFSTEKPVTIKLKLKKEKRFEK